MTTEQDSFPVGGSAPLVRGRHREPDGSTRLELVGELDLSTSGQLVDATQDALAEGPGSVVLDATAVTFIDSTGIGTLLGLRRDCHEADCGFSVRTSPGIERVARLLGVHDLLTGTSDAPDVVA